MIGRNHLARALAPAAVGSAAVTLRPADARLDYLDEAARQEFLELAGAGFDGHGARAQDRRDLRFGRAHALRREMHEALMTALCRGEWLATGRAVPVAHKGAAAAVGPMLLIDASEWSSRLTLDVERAVALANAEPAFCEIRLRRAR